MTPYCFAFQRGSGGDSEMGTPTKSVDIARNMDLIQKELERLRQENSRLQVGVLGVRGGGLVLDRMGLVSDR